MDAYAVIETGGKQYRVKQGDILDVEKLDVEPGQKVTLDRVLALNAGSSLVVGAPVVAGASVTAEVVDQHRGEKVVNFKKKRRKGYHRKVGHRQSLTRLKVEAITA
ncbi:MAG: 50S ribosomal protein L21 [Kiritimatiellae bacterium]|nr:50S ribosomal protein L21 [Kiritimatiellia bacterium]MCO5045799.1 50S ribosomal protein L21 [Kiritimatiellia bacterium]MCO5069484.1 50S ribosomal protein L21 [Kiritimatiellia bacterium]MCO6401268.1 50S ribosomal protein L21 [Verrucomicrobiota bacterium]